MANLLYFFLGRSPVTLSLLSFCFPLELALSITAASLEFFCSINDEEQDLLIWW
jgi:hypothetical protein